jgi:DHA1 family bicyclomycin/chloramphenicol resistance-like MFS transporter
MLQQWLLNPTSKAMLILLSALAALGPLATDMYLPALPLLTEVFGTSLSAVQLTLSSYFIGFAVFHLVCGPAADRYGRKPVLLLGFLLFFAGCLGCAVSTTVEQLIVWRFVQGAGACTGSTLCRTFIRDAYGVDQTTSAMGTMTAIMTVAPIVAPSIGGLILTFFEWRALFGILVLYSGLGILAILFLLPETLNEAYRQHFNLKAVFSNYRVLLSDLPFVLCLLGCSFTMAGFFSFITGASFVLIGFMDVSVQMFGLWFVLSALGYMGGSYSAAHFASKLNPKKLITVAALCTFFSGLLMVILMTEKIVHPLTVFGPMMIYCFSMGVIMPNAIAVALSDFPHIAGTASALIGFIQMVFAAIASSIVGVLLVDNPLPMALVIMCCGCAASLLFYCFKRL